jgi:hypothetical protein
MSTPIQSNSEALQRILQAVNSLPDAGSGDESTVQTKSGTFNSDANYTVIDCGFQPDIVSISYASDYYGEGTVSFKDNSEVAIFIPEYSDYLMYGTAFQRTETGFQFNYFQGMTYELGYENPARKTISYTAVKYT